MSRPLRIEYPGAWYHVMNRGANFKKIFTEDADREEFLKLLGETKSKSGDTIQVFLYYSQLKSENQYGVP